jgi:hypothetical protein
MAAIATEARVAAKSVYSLGDKATLLTLALDRAIAGDDEPVPLADRPGLHEVLTAVNGAEMARLGARLGAPMLVRLYPLYRAFEQAAGADPELASRWRDYQERRRLDVRRVVEAVERVAPLRAGLDIDRATDTLWALIGWHPVALLVEQRGWGLQEIQPWIEDLFVAILLGDVQEGEPD